MYDSIEKKSYRDQSAQENIVPVIEFFSANTDGVHIGDELLFKWKTINADEVVIEPFGSVGLSGEIKYRIKGFKNKKIDVFVKASNKTSGKTVSKMLSIRNLTYDEIYNEIVKNTNKKDGVFGKAKEPFICFDRIDRIVFVVFLVVSIIVLILYSRL